MEMITAAACVQTALTWTMQRLRNRGRAFLEQKVNSNFCYGSRDPRIDMATPFGSRALELQNHLTKARWETVNRAGIDVGFADARTTTK